jgi:SecD/SecF fusion protein
MKQQRPAGVRWFLTLVAGLALVASVGCRRTPTLQRDGGVRLVYEIDFEAVNQPDDRRDDVEHADDLPGLPHAILRELRDYPGAAAKVNGETTVEITVPGVREDEGPAIKQLISGRGTLEFFIVANVRDHAEAIEKALSVGDDIVQVEGRAIARWVNIGLEPPGDGPAEYRAIQAGDILRGRHDADEFERIELADDVLARIDGERFTIADAIDKLGFRDVQVLVIVDRPGLNITGRHIQRANRGVDGSLNFAIDFQMTNAGTVLMERLTSNNLPDRPSNTYRRLGIVLDGELISAPRLMSTIGRDGQITGNFTEAEVDHIVDVLRAGRLPVLLKRQPVSEEWIAPP